MSEFIIIDTNVLVAANGRNTHADLKCQLACIDELENIKSEKIVFLDNLGMILDEYSKYCSYKGEPGVGDYFFKYVYDNQLVQTKCQVIPITQDPKNDINFLEIPIHADLDKFDPSDRKFIAVSISSSVNPPICNATDSDWEAFKKALTKINITVQQLCPQHAQKRRSK